MVVSWEGRSMVPHIFNRVAFIVLKLIRLMVVDLSALLTMSVSKLSMGKTPTT